jgi:hypothetical protein
MVTRSKKLQTTPVSLGCLPSLFIVFLLLKLSGKIAWSWWWVISPLLVQLGFFVFFMFILAVLIPRALGGE